MTALDQDEGKLLDALVIEARALGRDELDVLVRIAKRLRMGAAQYGRLDIHGDARTWRKEMLEEMLDALVYGSAELVRGEDRS